MGEPCSEEESEPLKDPEEALNNKSKKTHETRNTDTEVEMYPLRWKYYDQRELLTGIHAGIESLHNRIDKIEEMLSKCVVPSPHLYNCQSTPSSSAFGSSSLSSESVSSYVFKSDFSD